MVKLYDKGVFISREKICSEFPSDLNSAKQKTIAYKILKEHNKSGNMSSLNIRFDALASHDITYVGIIQTARASGLDTFSLPYVLTNCHNSLCAVGGTINEDDHVFGLSAAKKYGGIFVPPHIAVIHQYMREMMSGCGKMILGSDSHTRYGALGTMAIGEGGPELVKQILGKTYDCPMPEVVGVYLSGSPIKGVGPQDIALAIIKAVFKNGYVKNKIMEFIGDGIKNLNVEFRNGIDVMTTETTCLSSVWQTDDAVAQYYADHNRENEYKKLSPEDGAYYDGMIYVDMSKIVPMIAMPFHPSNVYTVEDVIRNPHDILSLVEKGAADIGINLILQDKIIGGKLLVDQGVIAGCAGGTFDNICDATDILDGYNIGYDKFSLSIYPASQPTYLSLVENGYIASLMKTGATIRTAFCGPCFGAGDVPSNNSFSIRHTTRNFPNREGSKPSENQIASVALMDARSIAATAVNHGFLTPATVFDGEFVKPKYFFNSQVYKNRCYSQPPSPQTQLQFGPNIADWPEMIALTDNILLKMVSVINDDVTTTDELIPSGEASSYRSNPYKLAEFTLSRKDPEYVRRAKEINKEETQRRQGQTCEALSEVYDVIRSVVPDISERDIEIGSAIFARKPGDGSAREQAASCQRVLGGLANIALEYATKRYRSNLINWGMLPLIAQKDYKFEIGDYVFIPNIRHAVKNKQSITAYLIRGKDVQEINLLLSELTDDETDIILKGCLINFYRT